MLARSFPLPGMGTPTGLRMAAIAGMVRRTAHAMCTLVLGLCLLVSAGMARADQPATDQVYVNGQTYYMIGPHMITNPNPSLLAQSQELYLLVYPAAPGVTGPITLASGYVPQCNPCFHPGLPLAFVHHDHVMSGAPGLGNNGTAGDFKGPWKIIVLMYDPKVLTDPNFTPITSETAIDTAEMNGEFLPINTDPNAPNPYEVVTGAVLICPLVSPNA